MSRQDKSTTERNARILRELVKQPDNKACADCRKNGEWSPTSDESPLSERSPDSYMAIARRILVPVLICLRRTMGFMEPQRSVCGSLVEPKAAARMSGADVETVKSIDLDIWTPEQMDSMQKWGNHRANLYWERHLKAGHVPPEHKIESFIRSKYESRRWAMEGPPPSDPSTLEGGAGQAPHVEHSTRPTPTSTAPAAAPAAQPRAHPLLSRTTAAKPAPAATSTSIIDLMGGDEPPALAPAVTTAPPSTAVPTAAVPQATAAAAPPAPTAAPTAGSNIFDLDFRAPTPSTSSKPQTAKADIMSLFSTPSPTATATNNTNSFFNTASTGTIPAQSPYATWGGGVTSSAPPQQHNATQAPVTGPSGWGGLQMDQGGWGAPAAPVQSQSQPQPAAREEDAETTMAENAEGDDHGLGSSCGCVVWKQDRTCLVAHLHVLTYHLHPPVQDPPDDLPTHHLSPAPPARHPQARCSPRSLPVVVGRGSNLTAAGGVGYQIVDAIDGLLVLGFEEEYQRAAEWVRKDLSFDVDAEFNTFETTIRLLGGLLSAYYLTSIHSSPSIQSDSPLYLEKSIDLADRILGAFDTPSGIPLSNVNLAKREGRPDVGNGGVVSLAEAASLQLELKYLSHVTGDYVYWRKAERVTEVVRSQAIHDGIAPIFLNLNNGQFVASDIRLGSRGDSYYEYLLKQWLQTDRQEPVYRDMYDEAMGGIKKHLIGKTSKSNLIFTQELQPARHPQSGQQTWQVVPKQDHLVCFLGGSFVLGVTEGGRREIDWEHLEDRDREDMVIGKGIIESCVKTYETATGLGPEIAMFVQWSDEHRAHLMDWYIKPSQGGALIDARNILRPETVESLFLAYRATGDEIYREWGWKIFQAFQKYCRVPTGGYAGIEDVQVDPPVLLDRMETFWLGETLKYLYLLFDDSEHIPLDKNVFNTEAHILPVFTPTMLTPFSTS
ncbi:mannosyl-oligosaccharide alpha-1,2-mannosidase [Saitozyma podzolica]|uniref:alpha-1,2-Mannosidase n=1 Tax=Saitozyma podzolica TaxID=1890683 RepID=A0A427XRC6_9TREE|nr:mannosyl-oligosaccharide alpha-1,2-mannosidase [Saitozyma podzolica]